MSGGHFDYNQYRIEDIASEIDSIILHNGDESEDEYGNVGYSFNAETIERFKETAHNLRRAAEMTQRVDWLICGDDGEESFHRRWDKEVRESYDT